MKRGQFFKSLIGIAIAPKVIEELGKIEDKSEFFNESDWNTWVENITPISNAPYLSAYDFYKPEVALELTKKYGKGIKAVDILRSLSK